MQFFVAENSFLNKATNADEFLKRDPGMADSLAAVHELRQQNREQGTDGWMYNKEWKHVASIRGPVMAVAELLDPHFLNRNGKRDFYKWLDTNRRYATYDRRHRGFGHLEHGIISPGRIGDLYGTQSTDSPA